ncbi:hypothetical protein DL770_000784 [Monosporascus sp. CRB-9-2]|nr:hypothetical protein DL770_000784 [Monosporascus sp. CRB-9-2]
MVEYLEEKGQQLVYLLNAIPRNAAADMLVELGALGVLRQIGIQSLQKIRPSNSAEFLAIMVERFQRASTCEEWFDTLKVMLRWIPKLCLVIDLGVLGDRFEDAKSWASDFQGLFGELQAKNPSTRLKVVLLNCRAIPPILPASISVYVVAVGAPSPLPPKKSALQRQRLRERRPTHPFRPPLYDRDGDSPATSLGTCIGPPLFRPNPSHPETQRDSTTVVGKPPRPTTRHNFEIAIICALPLEADAVQALFDLHWDDDGLPFDKAPGDSNAYSAGVIGRHNVILLHMPGMGKADAATVAACCRASFLNIKLVLVVGVCGAIPFGSSGDEIILGDVIISDGIIQYDIGRQLPGRFVRKDTVRDSLGRPSTEIRGILAKLKALRGRNLLGNKIAGYLDILQQNPLLAAKYPGTTNDKLFESGYCHVGEGSCDQLGCNGKLLPRRRLQQSNPEPTIHFGLIASGDKVMKSGKERDAIAAAEGIIAFEMEGAGIWDSFPCLVIKGVCDYADSHKNKAWQRYAAATAAACMRAFLSYWVPSSPICARR